MGLFDVSASSLFVSRASQQAQMEGLAQRQLGNALELFVAKKYDEAISTFKRAIGLAPLSSTATNAYDYMARAYLSKEDVNSAIAAYKESLRGNPTNAETHVALGRIYVTQEDLPKAKEAFSAAVRLDPSSANRYSLGQTLMELGEYAAAKTEFNAVREMEPGKPNGDYALGLLAARQGNTADAVASFSRAISLQKDFWEAHVELGYALTNQGERDKATEEVETMQAKAPDLASQLESYIFEKTPAEMVSVFASSTFQKSLGPKTEVADLGDYLSNPGDQQMFSMVFAFNKPMDEKSIENVGNWTISRANDITRGTTYNFGMAVADTEVSLNRSPISVSYNAEDQTATVLFRVTQNATGTGTIDPSHIKFSFSGNDVLGLKISDKADEYSGFNGFA